MISLRKGKRLEQVANMVGLSFDDRIKVAYGMYNGYKVVLKNSSEGHRNYELFFSLRKDGADLTQKELSEVVKKNKSIKAFTVRGNIICYDIKDIYNIQKSAERMKDALDDIVEFLRVNGCRNSCLSCGCENAVINIYNLEGNPSILCETCFNRMYANPCDEVEVNENVVAGIVGAFLGSLVGLACIVLFGRLNYIIVLSGVIMSVCTLKGYEWLGKKLSGKGMIISIVLMIIMIYLGNRLEIALKLAYSLKVDIFTSFRAIPYLARMELIDTAAYYGNLVLLYLLTFIVSSPFIKDRWKAKEFSKDSHKLF